MSEHGSVGADLLARLRKLVERSNQKLGEVFDDARLDELREWARRQLSEGARRLELSGLEEAEKRLSGLLERLLGGRVGGQGETPPTRPAAGDGRGEAEVGQPPVELDVQVSKFDIARSEEVAAEARTLPWGYGQTRVTAMFVDADRLFTFWEVTDPDIAAARAGLGPGGPGAWLNLRVYDVSGRIFDGTNAHSYIDQEVSRTDRQWFFQIARPGSSAVVELGMKSHEGFFVKVARSGRVDFPRRTPAPAGDVEWLTVRPGSGEVAHHATESRRPWAGDGGGPVAVAEWNGGGGAGEPAAERIVAMLPGETVARRWDWQVIFPGDWQEIRRTLSWEGPLVRTSWEAGPFFVPVELPSRVEEIHTGDVETISRNGVTRVVYGPWRVVIRGIGAHAERRVLGVWELTRAWTETGARLTTARWRAQWAAGQPGASELLTGRASEVLVRGASELRLGGASEVFYLGASEVRLGGASETLYLGASEVRLRGASELRLGGATEWQFRGASERIAAGASELRLGGASERRLGGASERTSPTYPPGGGSGG